MAPRQVTNTVMEPRQVTNTVMEHQQQVPMRILPSSPLLQTIHVGQCSSCIDSDSRATRARVSWKYHCLLVLGVSRVVSRKVQY
jgi:hypothetical protein